MTEGIRIGISACLLGRKVRYDGGHKLDRYLSETLGRYVEYVPVCPEVECGLGTPREAMHLEGGPLAPRLMTIRSRLDLTEQMKAWASRRVRELEKEGLCGFIFKKDSPSSGMEHVRVYNDKGVPARSGRGLFAAAFMDRFPTLPVEDEGRLNDPDLRENFIERIFTYGRWRAAKARGMTPANLVDFHTRHKLLVMAHSPREVNVLGRLVASLAERTPAEAWAEYESTLMRGLKLRATQKKNANVLSHVMGYFRRNLTSDEKQELVELIEVYRKGNVPLIVPVTLLNHYVRKYGEPYLQKQVYLNPHPLELKLRNHV